jgi:hypothetical protein
VRPRAADCLGERRASDIPGYGGFVRSSYERRRHPHQVERLLAGGAHAYRELLAHVDALCAPSTPTRARVRNSPTYAR